MTYTHVGPCENSMILDTEYTAQEYQFSSSQGDELGQGLKSLGWNPGGFQECKSFTLQQ